jgi:hypothetical protein
MTLTPLGFPGALTAAEYAQMSMLTLPRWKVAGPNDFAVTSVGTGFQVSVAPGVASAIGHRVDNSAPVTITLPEPGSGSLYYLIVLRRDWNSSGAVSIEYRTGGSARTVPAFSRFNLDDLWDEQPLALVKVTKGVSNVAIDTDMRLWVTNGGLYVAKDTLARDLLSSEYGCQVRVGSIIYTRLLNDTWDAKGVPIVADSAHTAYPKWNVISLTLRRLEVGLVMLDAVFSLKPGQAIAAPASNGNITNDPVFTISNSRFRPAFASPLQVFNAGPVGHGDVQPSGVVSLDALPPGWTMDSADQIRLGGLYIGV